VKTSDYKERLFELLPQLYHIYDKGDGSLKGFLEAIGETLDDMEQNISELYGDSFIESCNDWVVPYIGHLIGARLIDTDGNRNRQEVMKTIHWRKRKGNIESLEEMAGNITNWGVKAAEFFEQMGWSQNLNHIKLDHLQSPDLTDHKTLSMLGNADNRLLHNVDIRKPCGRKGWFQIKNIGFFLSTVMVSHYKKIPMEMVEGKPGQFTPAPSRFPVELFDSESRFPLEKVVSTGERLDNFGTGQTVDIYSQGILAATPKMPKWTGSPAAAPQDPALLSLKDEDGLMPVDWKVENGEPLEYIITPMMLFEKNNKAKLKNLGHLDLSASHLKYVKIYDGSSEINGRLVMRIATKYGFNRAFPSMVLKLQSDKVSLKNKNNVEENKKYDIFGGNDRQRSIYKDRMYCYLPEFCPSHGASRDFIIDRYGSAYEYIHNGTKKQPDDNELYNFTKLARATEGVIYPSRKLTASTIPFRPIYSLAKNRALQVIDRGQFFTLTAPAEGWIIKAWNRDNQPGGGMLRVLSTIKLTSLPDKVDTTEIDNYAVETPGHLIISIEKPSSGKSPEMEMIVTDERGNSILVYLPQVDTFENTGAFFYIADDGASYRVNGDLIPGGIIVKRTPESGVDGAFNTELLARYSAGQVLPIEGKTPIQQRIAVRCNLSKKVNVQSGLLAIDPVTGHIQFPEGERPEMPIAASYYHGLSSYLGAGSYFHDWDKVEENRLIRVSKQSAPDDTRHLRPPSAGVISKVKVFSSIEDGIKEAITLSKVYTQEGAMVVQIEDSEIYTEDIHIKPNDFPVKEALNKGLIIRAAEFQRPLWHGSLVWERYDDAVTDLLIFQGLMITRTPEIKSGRFKEIQFKDCSLLKERLILNAAVIGEEDRYPALIIDNCIVRDRISIHGFCNVEIKNSALDPENENVEALDAEKSNVKLERCTVTRAVKVKELYASESIFTKKVIVLNTQTGCIRYCRINESGDVLPFTYKCTTEPVTFCSDQPWESTYLKLRRVCSQSVCTWAENNGEIGVYHQANYTLKMKNLMLKFEEYLPVGLTPVLIDAGCD
jgi:hypothetical protein